jgi:hypothetical protein
MFLDGMCLAVLGKEESVLDVAGVVHSKTFLHHPTPISYTLLDASSKALLRSRGGGVWRLSGRFGNIMAFV